MHIENCNNLAANNNTNNANAIKIADDRDDWKVMQLMNVSAKP